MRNSYICLLLFCLIIGCRDIDQPESISGYELANQWVDLALYITKNTGSNSPTYASRAIGYMGLTMYETVVNDSTEFISILPQLSEYNFSKPSADFDQKIALNAGQSLILKLVYNQTSDLNKAKIDSLEEANLKILKRRVAEDIVENSISHGRNIAQQIFEWSKQDGGHRSYLKNFDKEWVHPEHRGSWQPPLFAQSFSHHPLHPYWGENRTFIPKNSDLPIPEYLEYNDHPESEYFKQFKEVYDKDLTLTQEEKEAALWWGDDPDDTFTPPGHSFYIAMKAVEHFKPPLEIAAQTYALVGISVADAFINCWKWKYHHFTERANTFIPAHIDESWESFWPDPPFPSFPSGHAMNAGAAATALISIYGDEFVFVDDAHVNRERDEVRDVDFIARKFNGFWEVAEETANSRFYGGIHIPYDNEIGLREGRKVAQNAINLKWKKDG